LEALEKEHGRNEGRRWTCSRDKSKNMCIYIYGMKILNNLELDLGPDTIYTG
jgi:hypothetical protein